MDKRTTKGKLYSKVLIYCSNDDKREKLLIFFVLDWKKKSIRGVVRFPKHMDARSIQKASKESDVIIVINKIEGGLTVQS